MQEKSVAIDGPAGAGKSTLARALARELGYLYVDTGAIYRTVALRAWEAGADPSDPEQIAPLLKGLDLRMDYGADGVQRMYLSGRDVTEAIRVHQISGLASQVAALPPVRDFLLDFQRRQAMEHDVVMDGRDIGTVVLPHAGAKVFLTAAPEARARRRLLELGTDIRFESRLADLDIRDGALRGITAEGPEGVYTLPCSHLLLCPGHSARDTFAMLHKRGVPMEAKPFAVGVRIEHRQADCDAAQYRQYAGHPGLPASTYKLSCHLPGGRAAYSFCVCPGGEVVAAASEAERVVTNGMSEFARDKENINGGLLVNVTPEDYGGAEDPLAGIAFQRKLESAAYALGGGDYRAPAQRVGDFLAGRPSVGPGRVHPSYRPGVTWTDLRRCLPPFVADTIAGALPLLGQKLRGYDDPDAVLTAVESRSSSPVRIPRDGTCQSSLRGLYPCGEGAGYAGGILSAAADGMHCAEQLCQSIQKESDCL